MSKAATEAYAVGPLTSYSEDEQMFRASVREFAEGEIRPRVEEMDEHAKMSPEECRAYLVKLGTHNPDGTLTEHYRDDGEPSKHRPTD